MKYLFGLLAILFVWFSGVQLNDPDGIWWIVMYMPVAILFGFAAFDKFFPMLTLVVSGISLTLALVHAPGLFEFITNDDGIAFSQGMSNEMPYIEKAREFGGALITSLASAWLYLKGKKQAD